MKDVKTKEQFVELRAQGLSFASIADKLKVSKPTLIEWSRKHEHDINNLKEIELEGIREKYRLLKHHRLVMFGKQLCAVETELAKRNLSDVPTVKLFDLLCRFSHEAQSEEAGKFSYLADAAEVILTHQKQWSV